jgi:hypothetical protein
MRTLIEYNWTLKESAPNWAQGGVIIPSVVPSTTAVLAAASLASETPVPIVPSVAAAATIAVPAVATSLVPVPIPSATVIASASSITPSDCTSERGVEKSSVESEESRERVKTEQRAGEKGERVDERADCHHVPTHREVWLCRA